MLLARPRRSPWLPLFVLGLAGCPLDPDVVTTEPAADTTTTAGSTGTDAGATLAGDDSAPTTSAPTSEDPPGSTADTGASDPGDSTATDATTLATSSADESTSDDPGTTGPVDPGDPGTPPNGITALIEIARESASPVTDAVVTLDGKVRHSDASGFVTFEDLQTKERAVARIYATGYAPATAVFPANPGGHNRTAKVTLLQHAAPQKFIAEDGIDYKSPDGRVRVNIPADSIITYQDPTLPKVSGEVELTVTLLDPTKALTSSPGPLTAIDGDDLPQELESVMMAEITVWHAGVPAGLANNTAARVELRVPETHPRHAAWKQEILNGGTPVVPAWWYDLEAGLWRQDPDNEGFLDLVDGDLIWSVDVAHFTWWNADVPWTAKNCVLVTVLDQLLETPIAGVPVTLEGKNYTGFYTDYTDDAGKACLEMPKGATAELYVGEPDKILDGEAKLIVGDATKPAACGSDMCQEETIHFAGKLCTPELSTRDCADVPPIIQNLFDQNDYELGFPAVCEAPHETCKDGKWSECTWQLPVPGPDKPADTLDSDCDGFVDDEVEDGCTNKPPQACAEFPYSWADFPMSKCEIGIQACFLDVWQPCTDIGPDLEEDPNTPLDDDCNGKIHEEFIAAAGLPIYGKQANINQTGDGNQRITAITVGANGDVYIAGYFTRALELPGVPPIVAANPLAHNMFVARTNKDGVVESLRAFDSGVDLYPQALARDPASGDVYLTGDCNGTLTLAGNVQLACKPNETFIARFAADDLNNPAWIRGAGDSANGQVSGGGGLIARAIGYSTSLGGVFIAGSYTTAVWNGAAKIGVGDDIFLGRINKDGGFGPFVDQASQDDQRIRQIHIDEVNGSVIVIGDFFGSIYGTMNTGQATQGFFARLDLANPAQLQCKYIIGQDGIGGGTGVKLPRALASLDNPGKNTFVAGMFTDGLPVKGNLAKACLGDPPQCDKSALFVISFAGDGCQPQWFEVIHDDSPDDSERGVHLASDDPSVVLVSGDYRGLLTAGESMLPGDANNNAFLLRMRDTTTDPQLDPVETITSYGSSQYDFATALALTPAPDPHIFVGLQHTSTVTVPLVGNFPHHGSGDALLLSILK